MSSKNYTPEWSESSEHRDLLPVNKKIDYPHIYTLAKRFMKSVYWPKPGYASITCSTISNIPYNLIFTTQFNDSSILITIFSCGYLNLSLADEHVGDVRIPTQVIQYNQNFLQPDQGRIQDFKLEGALKIMAPSGARLENFGVFRVKYHDFTQKNRVRPPLGLDNQIAVFKSN